MLTFLVCATRAGGIILLRRNPLLALSQPNEVAVLPSATYTPQPPPARPSPALDWPKLRPTPTNTPTWTPYPISTDTLRPTYTAQPTYTSLAAYTPYPAFTPHRTFTPNAGPTNVPPPAQSVSWSQVAGYSGSGSGSTSSLHLDPGFVRVSSNYSGSGQPGQLTPEEEAYHQQVLTSWEQWYQRSKSLYDQNLQQAVANRDAHWVNYWQNALDQLPTQYQDPVNSEVYHSRAKVQAMGGWQIRYSPASRLTVST